MLRTSIIVTVLLILVAGVALLVAPQSNASDCELAVAACCADAGCCADCDCADGTGDACGTDACTCGGGDCSCEECECTDCSCGSCDAK